MKTLVCGALLVGLGGSWARADDWVTPVERTVSSPGGTREARITPAKDGKAGARATVGEKGRPAQGFTLSSEWMPVDVVLLDDGTLVTFDQWHAMGYGEVAIAYAPGGQVRWSRKLGDLLPAALVEQAPHSVSSIWWRRHPLEWSLSKDRKALLVTLFDENRLAVSLSDGAATVVAVSDLPEDAPRLVNRARALAAAGQPREAVAVLERALQADRDSLQAYLLLCDTLQGLGEHARVALLVEPASRRWGATHPDRTNLANVYVSWAQSLAALKRPDDAERALRLARQAEPGYSRPALELAKLLVGRGRAKDADEVLADLFTQVQKTSPMTADYAALEIGDFYRGQKQPEKALSYYRTSYRKDQVTNQFLYVALAQVLEGAGHDQEALEIHEQLLAYFERQGSAFSSYADSARGEVKRLRAKLAPRP